MRIPILLAATLATAPVQASGGIWCSSEDGPVKIELQAGVTHGMGFAVFDLRATAETEDKKVREDLRNSSFGKSELAQYWFRDGEIRVGFYREQATDPFGSVEVVIRANADDEPSYSGDYTFTAYDNAGGKGVEVVHKGKINCGAE
ncbi:hypothetical protein KEU06_14305 [Pseudaminobacter sp. 19-2017]|uniref:Uncharacterized protein n=1 Tax=Pseudaminobacter soli (ex Zhang et al. 2022) TaxID=2831468 RepID=A0A942E2F0_9HYPH|nr:hypothetical protein [Pseudaminobacter soli]MBS3649781.1 hypothetical protein [Pseudaminobacter soli]